MSDMPDEIWVDDLFWYSKDPLLIKGCVPYVRADLSAPSHDELMACIRDLAFAAGEWPLFKQHPSAKALIEKHAAIIERANAAAEKQQEGV